VKPALKCEEKPVDADICYNFTYELKLLSRNSDYRLLAPYRSSAIAGTGLGIGEYLGWWR
jgi:hypothetical protein